MHSRKILALVLVALLVPFSGAVASSSNAVPASSPEQQAVEVSTLVEMVKERPLNLEDVAPLLGTAFLGDTVRLTSVQVEPLSFDPLVEYFDDWRFAARLQLLLDYASWQLAREHPRTYDGDHAEHYRSRDREADLRIANLVRETGYYSAWQPFIAIYKELHREASQIAREFRSDSRPGMMRVIDQVARSHLEGVIEEYPIDPQIVAHEMVRLLDRSREMLGVSIPARRQQHLFHFCGVGSESTVVTTGDHPLASVFFVAMEAGSNDAAANKIAHSYAELVSTYEAWASKRPKASPKKQLARIRVLTQQLQIIEQLNSYSQADSTARGGQP